MEKAEELSQRMGSERIMVETDISITAADLYDYYLMHNYHSSSGIVGSTAGALCVVAGFMTQRWALLIAGLVVLFYIPVTLYGKSRLQWNATESFHQPLHYVLDEGGITVSQGEVKENQPWESMVKAVSTSRSIIIYTAGRSASIFPRAQLGDQQGALIEVISTHMPPAKVRIRS